MCVSSVIEDGTNTVSAVQHLNAAVVFSESPGMAPNGQVTHRRTSVYSRIFVSLPFRTVMSKTQSSLNVLVVALIFPVATPTTKTRHPCATNSGGFGYVVSISSAPWRSPAATPACPRCVPASGQSSPGMIHSMPSSTSASSACLSPLPIAVKKSLTTCTFSSLLIESLLSFLKCVRMHGTVHNHPSRPQSQTDYCCFLNTS